MGSYEVKVYLDNQLLKKIDVKNDTPLSDIRNSIRYVADFNNDMYYYYFVSKNKYTLKKDSNFIAKDVVQEYNGEYRINMISEQHTFKANIYIDNQLIKNIKVSKQTKLTEIRNLCKSNFKSDVNNYYFALSNGEIIKNDSDFTVEKVWTKEGNNEYKIQFKAEKIMYRVNIYIDDSFKTYINISKDTRLSDIRDLCRAYFQDDKNYYFVLESDAIVKNDSNLIAENIIKKVHNDYKIYMKSEDTYRIVSVYLNEVKKTGILCNNNQSLNDIKNKLGQDININDIYFLTTNRAIIENYNLDDFKLRDIIVDNSGEPKFYIIDKSYRPRFAVIEHLNMLRDKASSGPINWYEQSEFFKKVEDFAGYEIANGMKDELIKNIDPKNEEKANDKDFINKYIILLMKRDDIGRVDNRNNF